MSGAPAADPERERRYAAGLGRIFAAVETALRERLAADYHGPYVAGAGAADAVAALMLVIRPRFTEALKPLLPRLDAENFAPHWIDQCVAAGLVALADCWELPLPSFANPEIAAAVAEWQRARRKRKPWFRRAAP